MNWYSKVVLVQILRPCFPRPRLHRPSITTTMDCIMFSSKNQFMEIHLFFQSIKPAKSNKNMLSWVRWNLSPSPVLKENIYFSSVPRTGRISLHTSRKGFVRITPFSDLTLFIPSSDGVKTVPAIPVSVPPNLVKVKFNE